MHLRGSLPRAHPPPPLTRDGARHRAQVGPRSPRTPYHDTFAHPRRHRPRARGGVRARCRALRREGPPRAARVAAVGGRLITAVNRPGTTHTRTWNVDRRRARREARVTRALRLLETDERLTVAVGDAADEASRAANQTERADDEANRALDADPRSTPPHQLSPPTPPDRPTMATSGGGGGVGGYVEEAVEAAHHLLVAPHVATSGAEGPPLPAKTAPPATVVQTATPLPAVDGRDYCSPPVLAARHAAGTVILPPPPPSAAATAGGRGGQHDVD